MRTAQQNGHSPIEVDPSVVDDYVEALAHHVRRRFELPETADSVDDESADPSDLFRQDVAFAFHRAQGLFDAAVEAHPLRSQQRDLRFSPEATHAHRMLFERELLKVFMAITYRRSVQRALVETRGRKDWIERFEAAVADDLSPVADEADSSRYFNPLRWNVQREAVDSDDHKLLRFAKYVEGLIEQEAAIEDSKITDLDAAERAARSMTPSDLDRSEAADLLPDEEEGAGNGMAPDAMNG